MLSVLAAVDGQPSSDEGCLTCVEGGSSISGSSWFGLVESLWGCACPAAALLPGNNLGATFTRARRDAISAETDSNWSTAKTQRELADAI